MDIGSKIEKVKPTGWECEEAKDCAPGVIVPDFDTIYTVRGFYESAGKVSIYLEEIVNAPLMLTNVEPSFEIECFRELMTFGAAVKMVTTEKLTEKLAA